MYKKIHFLMFSCSWDSSQDFEVQFYPICNGEAMFKIYSWTLSEESHFKATWNDNIFAYFSCKDRSVDIHLNYHYIRLDVHVVNQSSLIQRSSKSLTSTLRFLYSAKTEAHSVAHITAKKWKSKSSWINKIIKGAL